MPAGARRQPAAERGVGERLREVAQCQVVPPQLVLQRGSVDTGLDAGGTAGPVDLQHPVECTEIH